MLSTNRRWNGSKGFQHGETRSNQTHESTTDPDALLARKGSGKEAKLSYTGNLLVENRNGLIVTTELFQANGTAERDAGLVMLEQIPGEHRVTVGADKGYDTRDFVAECRNQRGRPILFIFETAGATAGHPDGRRVRPSARFERVTVWPHSC